MAYYTNILELLLKYPKNLQKNDFRNFRSIDFLKQIIRKIFQREFPAALTDFLKKLEDTIVFLIEAKDTSKLTNIILVGPAGIGKTSLAKIIAMMFALAVSDESTISNALLDSALTNNEDLEILYNKLMELSSSHIIDIKGSSITDVNVITGTSSTYTGAKPGLIGEMLINKKLPVLAFFDEMDKSGNFHGGGGKKAQDAIYTALLNALDGQGMFDVYLAIPLKFRGVFIVQTANTLNDINATYLNRLEIINLESPALEEKKKICFFYLLKMLKNNNLIASMNSYTTEKDSTNNEILRYIISDKENKIRLVIDDKIFTSVIVATQDTDGMRAPLRLMDALWTKLYLQILDNAKHKRAQDFHINIQNLHQYLSIDTTDSEVIRGKNIAHCIYEALDGNHRFGYIAVMPVKNRTGEVISIIGDDQNHGIIFNSVSKLISGMINNLLTIVDNQYYSKFSLGLVDPQKMNFNLTMPNDAVKSAYINDLIATILVIIIATARKIPLKENVIIVGRLVPTGQFLKGSMGSEDKKDKIKYKNVIASITNNTTLCNILILPSSLKNDQEVQGYLKKLPKRVRIFYAANLGELLEYALDASQIS